MPNAKSLPSVADSIIARWISKIEAMQGFTGGQPGRHVRMRTAPNS
jgi:hypothetical protein